MKERIMLFCRAKNNRELIEQKTLLSEFCSRNDYEIVSEHSIIGSWHNAPASLYQACGKHKGIDKVVFESWDRIGRTIELCTTCSRAFRTMGIELECATGKHRRIRRKCLTSNDIA